jgi:GAF domain-containing protein
VQLVAPQVREFLTRESLRSLLAVPLIREEQLLGGIVILRRGQGAFAPDVVALLQTFATQSVLAIHNAGLFSALSQARRDAEAANELDPEMARRHPLRAPRGSRRSSCRPARRPGRWRSCSTPRCWRGRRAQW